MGSGPQLVESMQVNNFACLREVEIQLTSLHAFIGPNDSGKSTLLRALRTALHLSTSVFVVEDQSTFDATGLHDGGQGIKPFAPGNFEVGTSIGLSLQGHAMYRFACRAKGRIEETFMSPSLTAAGLQRGWLSFGRGEPTLGPLANPALQSGPLGERLRSGARLAHMVPNALREPSGLIPEDGRQDFADDFGTGLPGILDAVLNRGDDSFLKIIEGVKRLFPTVRTIRLRPISRDTKVIEIELTSGTRVPATFASEGLLFYLAFAALQFLDPVAMLLVEEPENGLHPARIADVMKILREISQTTQVVLATHSPLVINEMQGDEVTLVTRDPDKGTQVRRLSDTPNFAERSKVYALGELWLSYANGVDEAPLLADGNAT